ncbi:TetR/AcrR family transcriptional regulator [Pediococcus ethanolidurans]|uniref:TetR/AcrR family transcriptional regulator n=1 Tax=Pediococcus ethanolidurans TaxID=319653 RepID=UPI0029552E74|nr:TetR/AcrR family transcriptional regulator [Pediococcus ethanolidurans]
MKEELFMSSNVFTNYKQWLNDQTMPKGRRAVILSSLDLFSRQGYDGTSTAQIAQHADVSQATIFKYFKTKQDLLMEIIKPMINNLAPVFRDDFFSKLNEHNGLQEIVHFVVFDRYKFLKENAAAFQILLSEIMTNETVRAMFFDLVRQSQSVIFNSALNKMVEDKLVRPGLTLVDLARTIIGQLITYFLQRNFITAIPTDETADLKRIEDLIIHAIRP